MSGGADPVRVIFSDEELKELIEERWSKYGDKIIGLDLEELGVEL